MLRLWLLSVFDIKLLEKRIAKARVKRLLSGEELDSLVFRCVYRISIRGYVRPSIRPSVRPLVRRSVTTLLKIEKSIEK